MRIRQVLRRGEAYAVVFVILSLVAFAGVSFVGDSTKFLTSLGHVSIGLVLNLAGLTCINYVLRSVRFQMFARCLGIRVPFGWMLVYYIAGFAMSATPGKLGEVVRLWLIRHRHGYRIEHSLPLQIADRALDVVASVVLCIGALGAFSGYWNLVIGAGIVVATGVILLMQPALFYWGINVLYRSVGRQGRWFARARRLLRTVARLFKPRIFVPALTLTIVGWWAECLALDLCMQAVAGTGDIGRATFIFTFSNLVGGLTLLPGGVGTTEISMASLMVATGIEFESAATITAVIRFATLWFGMALGLLFLAIFARTKTMASSTNRHARAEPYLSD